MSLEKHKEILLEGILKDIYKKMEEDGKKKQELRNSLKKEQEVFDEFKKLYNRAKQTKSENDIVKALEYYKENKKYIKHTTAMQHKANEIERELLKLYEPYRKKKEQEKYNKKWAHRNGQKVTIPEIKKHLMIIVRRLNSEQKTKDDFKKYDAKLICHLFEDYDNYVIFEMIDGDQESHMALRDYLYIIGKELENVLPVDVDYGDGDEGCLYISY